MLRDSGCMCMEAFLDNTLTRPMDSWVRFLLLNVDYIGMILSFVEALKLERIRGVLITFRAFKSLVSGALIPLSMFPPMFRVVTEFLPMKFYIYIPVNALLTGGNMEELAGNMVLALTWILVLTAASAWQWNSGLKRLQANVS